MAFADARTTHQKLGAGAAVILIEAGIGLALVAGLTATGTIVPSDIVRTFNVPEKKDPPPPPEPPVKQQAKQDPSTIDRPRTQIEIPTGTGPIFEYKSEPSGNDGSSTIGEVEFPVPEPSTTPPPPQFKPKAALPKGKMAQWVTTNDYPSQELRLEHEGTTRYRLTIDAKGAVSDCTVTTSSGWPGLDRAACDNVKRRAKFEPATDQAGARTTGTFTGSVTWVIPKE
jgi:periplasmic protein TonB